ncbi:CLUMA_CG002075, isoform A [Clunio marinus]|uniref:CLUMA_CG002075, isoform A n=1 Tax=Clunio marinus TaxID=568069 RepID=A0A1J1HJQ8_9DIPT|nr:CLUMA_CG002075, isoform A [Clunio marinus]
MSLGMINHSLVKCSGFSAINKTFAKGLPQFFTTKQIAAKTENVNQFTTLMAKFRNVESNLTNRNHTIKYNQRRLNGCEKSLRNCKPNRIVRILWDTKMCLDNEMPANPY